MLHVLLALLARPPASQKMAIFGEGAPYSLLLTPDQIHEY